MEGHRLVNHSALAHVPRAFDATIRFLPSVNYGPPAEDHARVFTDCKMLRPTRRPPKKETMKCQKCQNWLGCVALNYMNIGQQHT